MTTKSLALLNRTLCITFSLFIFGSTFSIAFSQIALGISLSLFLVLAIATRYNPFVRELKWFYLFAGLYVVWLLFTASIGAKPIASLLICKEEWLFGALFIALYLLRDSSNRRRLITVLAAGAMLFSVYAILQYLTGVNWFRHDSLTPAPGFGYRVSGPFSSRMTFANLYATVSMFLLWYGLQRLNDIGRGRRRFLLTAAILSVVATVLSFGRTPMAAILATMLIASVLMGARYFVRAGSVALAVAAAAWLMLPGLPQRYMDNMGKDFGGEYEGGRVFIWERAVDIIGEHPLLGVGQGNFQSEYVARLRPDMPKVRWYAHAHNDLLNIAAIAGIPGALFFLGMWLSVIGYSFMGWKHGREAGLRRLSIAALAGSLLFFITSLSEATFADEEVRQLLMFVWACGLFSSYKQEIDSGWQTSGAAT